MSFKVGDLVKHNAEHWDAMFAIDDFNHVPCILLQSIMVLDPDSGSGVIWCLVILHDGTPRACYLTTAHLELA